MAAFESAGVGSSSVKIENLGWMEKSFWVTSQKITQLELSPTCIEPETPQNRTGPQQEQGPIEEHPPSDKASVNYKSTPHLEL